MAIFLIYSRKHVVSTQYKQYWQDVFVQRRAFNNVMVIKRD